MNFIINVSFGTKKNTDRLDKEAERDELTKQINIYKNGCSIHTHSMNFHINVSFGMRKITHILQNSR